MNDILYYLSNVFNLNMIGGNSIDNEYSDYKKNRKILKGIQFNIREISKRLCNNVAIIVPYRDNKFQNRKQQLEKFLDHYKNFKNTDIYIIEQSNDKKKFNRGALLNAGYIIAKNNNYDMYIFHDVDLISPIELNNLYNVKYNLPIHIASLWKEKYNFKSFLGGIMSFPKEIYEKINGYPNNFFGWGGEDDAVYNRLAINDIYIMKPEGTVEIRELEHQNTSTIQSLFNENKKNNILSDLKNWEKDGLNSLKFKILDEKKYFNSNKIKKIKIELIF